MSRLSSLAPVTSRITVLSLALGAHLSAQGFPAYAVATQVLDPPSLTSASLAVGDIDGDGLADLVTNNSTDGGVFVYLGHGDGTFAHGLWTSGPKPTGDGPAIHDVTADGQADVVVLTGAYFEPAPLEIHSYKGGPRGALAEPISSTVVLPVEAIFPQLRDLGDIDGDGLDDALLQFIDLDFSAINGAVARNLGAGTFGNPIELDSGQPFIWATLALTDVDADGDLDIGAVRHAPSAAMQAFENDGTGVLTDDGTSGICPGMPDDGTFADLDGDGFADAIVQSQFGAQRTLLRGLGDGTFTAVASMLGVPSSAPFVTDLNGDALPDLVSGGYYQDYLETFPFLIVALGTGSFTFAGTTVSAVGELSELVAVQDVDSDGFADAIFGGSYSGEVTIVRGLPNGGFVTPLRVHDVAVPFELATADVDVDGDADVLAAHMQVGSAVSVLLNSAGALTPAVPLGLGTAARHLVAGDLDGDGRPDIIDDLEADGIAAWKNLPGGALAFAPLGTLGPGKVAELVLGDIEPDGDLDLLATHKTSGIQDVYLSHGDGTFAAATSLTTGSVAYGAVVADLDADGHPDFAVAEGDYEQITWLAGHGDGTFGPPTPIPTGEDPDRLVAADLDGDGVLDLAASTLYEKSVFTLHGLGGGTFAVADVEELGGKSRRLLVLDEDRDGVPDLVSTSKAAARISLLRGVGDGTLEPQHRLLSTTGAEDIATADFDGDGYPDIAVTNAQPAEVWVHFNLAPPFASLGFALTASYGTPNLLVTGEPVANTAVSFTVTGVPAQIPGFLFTSFATAYLPYKGGTLVPSPDVALPVQTGIPLKGRWPSGLPAGTAIYFQAWFLAASGEVSATQAVVAVDQTEAM